MNVTWPLFLSFGISLVGDTSLKRKSCFFYTKKLWIFIRWRENGTFLWNLSHQEDHRCCKKHQWEPCSAFISILVKWVSRQNIKTLDFLLVTGATNAEKNRLPLRMNREQLHKPQSPGWYTRDFWRVNFSSPTELVHPETWK